MIRLTRKKILVIKKHFENVNFTQNFYNENLWLQDMLNFSVIAKKY